jgi:L-threonylcarbamoyladenylate synthase
MMSAGHPAAIAHAVDVLRNGGLVAFPTDTVYGVSSLPFQAEYIEKLYIAKGRNSQRAIAILIGEVGQLKQVTSKLGEMATRLAQKFWPGPLTIIVPKHPSIPEILSSDETIGVRMPNHPVALALLQQGGPLAVTSANLSGSSNTNTAQEVLSQLGKRIHLILDGGHTPGGIPSSVVDCRGKEPVILREGPVSLEEIITALK